MADCIPQDTSTRHANPVTNTGLVLDWYVGMVPALGRNTMAGKTTQGCVSNFNLYPFRLKKKCRKFGQKALR